MVSVTELSITVTLLCFGFNHATDPVYSPLTLSDSVGNSADSDASITWASLPTGTPLAASSPERVEPQLEPYHNMVNGFIDVVFANGIPKDIIEKVGSGNLSFQELQSTFMGLIVCIGIGLLFVPIFMIVVCCMCCCRCCCGNCGGKRQQPEAEAKNLKRKYAFVIVLGVVIAFLFTGTCIIWSLNGSVSEALSTIPTTVDNNLNDLKVYANNTVDKVNQIATTNFQFMMTTINRDLENDSIAFLVGIPLRADIEINTNIRRTLHDAYSLSTDLDAADTALTDVETKNQELESSITTLDLALTTWRASIDTIFTNCGGSCPGPQPNTNVNTGVDPSQFPDLTSARTSMDNAISANLTAKLIEAEEELDTIPDTVAEKSYSTRNSLQNTTSDLSDDLDTVTKDIEDLQDKISGNASSLDDISDGADTMVESIRPYDQYRWYAYLALSLLVFTCTLIAALGLGFGVGGTYKPIRPEERGCVPHCGGCLLLTFAVMSAIVLLILLMFLTIPFFAIGSPMQAFICKPLTDLDYMAELWAVYNDAKVGAGYSYMGDAIHNNKSIQITPPGILRDCDNGISFWSTFRFDQKFDIHDLLDYSKTLDVQSEIDTVNVDLSSVEVYPTDLQNQLTDASDAINVDFNAFYQELNENATSRDLGVMADDIDQYVIDNAIPVPYSTDFTNVANDLRAIETAEYADVELKMTALNTSVVTMEMTVSPMPTKISSLQIGLQMADDFIQNNGSDIVKPHLNVYADRLNGIVDSYRTFTIDAILYQLGDCKPVWNLYNSFIVYTFCYNFIDLFNGSWFACGWCVFFFFFGFIFSLKLSKYFLRMTENNKIAPALEEKPGPPDFSANNNAPIFASSSTYDEQIYHKNPHMDFHLPPIVARKDDGNGDTDENKHMNKGLAQMEKKENEEIVQENEKEAIIDEGVVENDDKTEGEIENDTIGKDNSIFMQQKLTKKKKKKKKKKKEEGRIDGEAAEQYDSQTTEPQEPSSDLGNADPDKPNQIENDLNATKQKMESTEYERTTDIEKQEDNDKWVVKSDQNRINVKGVEEAKTNEISFKNDEKSIEMTGISEHGTIKAESSQFQESTVIDIDKVNAKQN